MKEPNLTWVEGELAADEATQTQALRLLARLLVRAAGAAAREPQDDQQIPLDVAAHPKVGSDRE